MVLPLMPLSPPVALTIAGSDNSAGAGLQADLKTFTALGVYGLTAVTCVVAEVPGKVSAIQSIDPGIVAEQIRLSMEAFPVGAIKTGMLRSSAIMESVCGELERRRLPLVVDPVMVATSGDSLLDPDALTLYTSRLFPLATVITPNLDEASALVGSRIGSLSEMREAGRRLVGEFGTAFLLKGGHLRERIATDLLFVGDQVFSFEAPYVEGVSTHGTGCTYSAAIAAHLARGFGLPEAVEASKRFITAAIGNYLRWNGTDALNHSSHFQKTDKDSAL